jgi:hypothetical protein
MVQNGESSGEQRKGEEDEIEIIFLEKNRRVGGTCGRKPHIVF